MPSAGAPLASQTSCAGRRQSLRSKAEREQSTLTFQISTSQLPNPAARPFEIVERKGLGHPDTICDALADRLSSALCQFWLERTDRILHHNVDKVLLCGGASQPRFGGGKVTAPIEIIFAGRATLRSKGIEAPIEELAIEVTRNFIREHFHILDPERHVRVRCLIRPSSQDLIELFERHSPRDVPRANDSSIGVGFAPLSAVEESVLAIDRMLHSPEIRRRHPAVGEDTKLMAVRRSNALAFTVACAFCDRHVFDLADYLAKKAALAEIISHTVGQEASITVNAADDPATQSVYLTVTGTSAEAGDDGEAERGNRANGLITPCRPMSMEGVAGKNPISHTGKVYNFKATAIAQEIIDGIPNTVAAECYLVSRIGQLISEPEYAHVRVTTRDGQSLGKLDAAIAEIVRANLSNIDAIVAQ